MTSMTRQYSAVASHASEAVEKAADSWVQGVRKLADRFPVAAAGRSGPGGGALFRLSCSGPWT